MKMNNRRKKMSWQKEMENVEKVHKSNRSAPNEIYLVDKLPMWLLDENIEKQYFLPLSPKGRRGNCTDQKVQSWSRSAKKLQICLRNFIFRRNNR